MLQELASSVRALVAHPSHPSQSSLISSQFSLTLTSTSTRYHQPISVFLCQPDLLQPGTNHLDPVPTLTDIFPTLLDFWSTPCFLSFYLFLYLLWSVLFKNLSVPVVCSQYRPVPSFFPRFQTSCFCFGFVLPLYPLNLAPLWAFLLYSISFLILPPYRQQGLECTG